MHCARGKETIEAAKEKEPHETFRFAVICVDRVSGKILWQKVAREASPHESRQENNTFASASPVTDGSVTSQQWTIEPDFRLLSRSNAFHGGPQSRSTVYGLWSTVPGLLSPCDAL